MTFLFPHRKPAGAGKLQVFNPAFPSGNLLLERREGGREKLFPGNNRGHQLPLRLLKNGGTSTVAGGMQGAGIFSKICRRIVWDGLGWKGP